METARFYRTCMPKSRVLYWCCMGVLMIVLLLGRRHERPLCIPMTAKGFHRYPSCIVGVCVCPI